MVRRAALVVALSACSATKPAEPSPPGPKQGEASAEEPLEPEEPFVVDAATGAYHTCALLKDGTVRCAGNNDHGQLGSGKFDDRKHPVLTAVPGVVNAAQITAGWTHTCAADRSGSVQCWGDDSATLTGGSPGAIGWGYPRAKPIENVEVGTFNRSMGVYRTLALTPKGVVMSWGEDDDGRDLCGAGSGKACAKTPMAFATPAGAVEVAATGLAACVRTSKGKVLCQGYDLLSTHFARLAQFTPLTGIEDAVSLAIGESHGCAALSSGRVVCWGRNHEGQLGLGHRDGTEPLPPSPVVELTDAVRVAIAWNRSCAVKRDGTVWCWGVSIEDDGSFGYYGGHVSTKPVQVPALAHVRSISISTTHGCAVTGKGRMSCWGLNESGEVADGTRDERPEPVSVAWKAPGARKLPVPDRSVIATDLATSDDHACALTIAGTPRTPGKSRELRCWGSNRSGQLGIGAADDETHPVPVKVLTSVTQMDLDSGRTCAIAGGATKCWGDNRWGALGDGTTTDRARPVAVSGIAASDVGVGLIHGCALGKDGAVRCWGSNAHGQLGVQAPKCPWQDPSGPSFGGPVDVPCLLQAGPEVAGLANVSRVVVGSVMSCAITADGQAWCWGENTIGQLGDGTRKSRSGASRVSLAGVVDIGIGNQHACALSTSGSVYCWGSNDSGQVGLGLIGGSRPIPVAVKGIAGAVAIAVGGLSSCAIFASGEARCWGGVPDVGPRSGSWLKPETVPSLPAITKIVLGSMHACALGQDGSLWCWGYAPTGILGAGKSRVSYPTPLRWR